MECLTLGLLVLKKLREHETIDVTAPPGPSLVHSVSTPSTGEEAEAGRGAGEPGPLSWAVVQTARGLQRRVPLRERGDTATCLPFRDPGSRCADPLVGGSGQGRYQKEMKIGQLPEVQTSPESCQRETAG